MNHTLSLISASFAFLVLATASSAVGAENTTTTHDNQEFRIIPQVTAGTAGLEPGLALEWRHPELTSLILRPEILFSEDERIGGGAALLGDMSSAMSMPRELAVAIGPRFVWHNSDASSWEADVMATWSYDLGWSSQAWRHSIGLLGALGVRHDREDDENSLGATAGAFYSFGF